MNSSHPKKFAMLGAAGFIAPKHMKAIRDTGNTLTAILDRSDSVGIIDSFFPDAEYFSEFERFDRHIEKLRQKGSDHQIDYVSICTPNYLHDAHMRFALRSGCHAICEKPVVLNPWNLDALQKIESEMTHRINVIQQLRLDPELQALKTKISASASNKKHQVELTYITSRGKWYLRSWKGDDSKSGGIATNIGVHFFDLLLWVFGSVEKSVVHHHSATKASGFLELKNASVSWFLSIDQNDIPADSPTPRFFRSIQVDGEEINLSKDFNDLHTASYRQILAGQGFSLADCRPSIELIHNIRHSSVTDGKDRRHNLLKRISTS